MRNDYKRKRDLIIDLFKTVAVQIPAPIILKKSILLLFIVAVTILLNNTSAYLPIEADVK
jgi:hypothetical protein